MTKTSAGPRLRVLIEIALFSAVTAILAQIAVPLPSGVPATLQTFAVALAGCYLGRKYGTASVLVYIMLGAAGLPVFSSLRGGFAVITGTAGGFIIGFLPLAALCGLGASMKSKAAAHSVSLLGLAACHLCGVLWFSFVASTAFLPAAALVSLPYLIKDAVSVFAALWISSAVKTAVTKAAGRQI